MNIAIGTAQFGSKYGVANKTGKVDIEEVKKIIGLAEQNNIKTIDTAISYGESQKVLGEIGVRKWDIITKLPKIPNDCEDIQNWAYELIVNSLDLLKANKFSGILIHDSTDLMGHNGTELETAICDLKRAGLVDKIGVSVYDPIEIERIQMSIDILQFPMNIFDRRFIDSSLIDSMADNGVELHARSIFLQGLLLMEQNEIPVRFMKWKKLFEKYNDWLNESKISRLSACLTFVRNYKKIDKIIVGIDTVSQLEMIVSQYYNNQVINHCEFKINDYEDLIDPRVW